MKEIKFWRGISLVFVLIVVPVVVYAGINFGHVDAVEEQVEDLDEQIKNNNAGTGSGPGQCSVNYGPWLSSINSMSDLDNELLETGLETGAKVNAIGNTRFSESDPDGTELTTDTMVQRCNTTFGDTGDPNYEHRIFCRGFRLPDGKQYDNFSDLKTAENSGPSDLVTLSFFHAGNIDDASEDWLIPFLDQYQNQCHSRTTLVILIGAYVYDHSMDPARRISEGNKWHLTATKWSGTDLEKSMDNSDLVVTGHSTASCPKVGSDTRGLYVGGNGENPGRRITNRVGSNALWVGTNSDSSAQCYSGVASDNPVNASGGGVQLEKQVTTSNPVPDDVIAETVLGEY